jgi:hypothetical protein
MTLFQKICKFLFNPNTGYFILQHTYNHKGRISLGWTLNRGYRILGIRGYSRINVYHDLEAAREDLHMLQNLNSKENEN